VDDLVATSDALTVTIRNAGKSAVIDEFWVDVYFDPHQTPSVNMPWDTIAEHGAVWGVTDPIPAGDTLVLTTGGRYYFGPPNSSAPPLPVGADVYAMVDSINHDTSYGMVQESDEGNNLYGPVASTQGQAIGNSSQSGRRPSMAGLRPR
jgi:hypothetical protein